MSVRAWLGVGLGGLAVLAGLALMGYGFWHAATTDPEGRAWSQEELYECELAPSCDEAAAAEEARLFRESEVDTAALAVPGFILVVLGALVFMPSLAAIPWVRRRVEGAA